MSTQLSRFLWTLVLLLCGIPLFGQTPVVITTTGTPYTQDFNSLANSGTTNALTIPGWAINETGGGLRDNEQYAADTGGSNTGDTYSYGATSSTERALGGLQSGTLIPTFGAVFSNGTGSTITSLAIAYTGEQWRLGATARVDRMDFQYSLDATSITTGTWVDVDSLDFTAPVTTGTIGLRDGNAAASRTAISSTISGLSISNGTTVWLRWTDLNAAGADDGLAVDDLSVTATAVSALNINDTSVAEGNAGTVTASFTVSLTAPAGAGGVTFDIATADNTATTAGNDYVARSLTGQTIPAGSSTYTFDVTVNGDTAIEPNETFFVNVTNVVGATPGDAQGLGTITNDDSPPNLSINDISLAEGNAGTTAFTFTVLLSAPAPAGGVTFDIATQDNSATTAGNDYVAKALTSQTIPAGSTSYSFTVDVNGDTSFEGNESFFVNVTNVVGAVTVDGQGTGTITNDDAAPSFTINDVWVTEGSAGTVTATFTVTLAPASTLTASIDYATADAGATAGSDYVATNGTLTFAPGETTKTINVTVNGDTTAEGDEAFVINLSNVSGGPIIGDAQGFGTIRNDDPFSIAAVDTPYIENFNVLAATGTQTTTPVGWTFVETSTNANQIYTAGSGSSGTGDTYSFGTAAEPDRAFGTLRSGALISTIGAQYRNDTGVTITNLYISYTGEQWRLGTASRTDRLDFQYSLDATSLSSGTWTDVNALDFTTPTITTIGAKDGNLAANRDFLSAGLLGLSIPSGATFWIRYVDIDASGADDGLAVDDFLIQANVGQLISINDVSVVEGNSGTTTATFTVSLSAPAGPGGVAFDIATVDSTATAPTDYIARSETAQVIPAGATTYTFNVTINGDVDQEPTETFFVRLTNVVGAIVTDDEGVGTIAADDFTLTPIHQVQGSGLQSPLAGATVTVSGIVTGLKNNGFFVQTPDAEVDADPNTSQGLFVFTSSTPTVAIGQRVAVTGTVTEFPSSATPHTLTEITSTSISVLALGQPLPTPVVITAADATPSANLSQYERYEAMRVTTTLVVVAPTEGSVNEPTATSTSNGVFFGVPIGVSRPMREPGVEITVPLPAGSPCCVPRFDTNPEKLRVDSDAQPGAVTINVATGQTVSNLVGPLDYGFFQYTILPDAATPPVVSGPQAATPVPVPTASELTIGSFNVERFFDTIDDPIGDPVLTAAAFNNRLNKASLAIRNVLQTPDVLGIVEVENLSTLQALATKINNDAVAAGAANPNYVAYLIEGNDIGGIDVGFLVKTSRVNVIAVTQVGKTATFTNPNTGAQETLHDRPPLMLEATVTRPDGSAYPFTAIVNHLRSLSGIETDDADGRRVRAKRAAQAEFLANFVQARQTANPSERIILVGDFNAFEFNDGYVDVIGTIKGTPTPPDQVIVASPDLVNPDLINLVETLPATQRYSFMFDGNAQTLDHALINVAFLPSFTRAAFGRLDADFPEILRNDPNRPEKLSDHDAIIAYFETTAANTAPVNTVPGPQTTYQNAPLVFSPANGNAISIADADAGTSPVAVTLTATNGVLTLSSVAGLTFTVGDGNADSTMTFTGSITNINAALAGLTFTPSSGFTGNASLVITTNDQGNTGTGGPLTDTDTVAITVTALPVLSINDVTVTEGDAGTSAATFTVSLSPASTSTVTVQFATANGTAVAGSDYVATMGTLTFAPGVTAQTITVSIVGDTVAEPSETFFVNLTATTNAMIGDGQGTATILDTDVPPSADLAITKTAPSVIQAGTNITFTLMVRNNGLSGATGVTVTDVLPAGMTASTATTTQGSCTGTSTVTCLLGSLASGASATVTISAATSTTPTVVSNTATVTATEGDPNATNNTATSMTTAVAQIPTLSFWVLLALAAGLGVVALTRLEL